MIIACHQFMPASMNPPASVYVVITTLMPIHRAAMFHVDHVRSLMVVGARSWFQSGLADTSLCSSTKSCIMRMFRASRIFPHRAFR